MIEIVVSLKEEGARKPAGEIVGEVAEKLREKFEKSADIRLKRFKRGKEKITLEYEGIAPEGDGTQRATVLS
jgi:hypothetical protein